MEKLKPQISSTYGMVITKALSGKTVTEDYIYGDMNIKLPLGEMLFNAVELLEVLEGQNVSEPNVYNQLLNSFFLSKEYNLSSAFLSFDISLIELARLRKIKDFILMCSQNSKMCSNNYLRDLAISLFPKDHRIFNLFNDNSRYKVRRLFSSNEIQFCLSTADLERKMNRQFVEYSFYSVSDFNVLSELCIISLFEIFDYKKIIKQCSMCRKFFIPDCEENYCNRPDAQNDFRGCLKYRMFLYNQDYRKSQVVRHYKKIYNRLQSRAQKSKRISDCKLFEEFKSEWAKLNKTTKHRSDRVLLQNEFLISERWC